MSYERSESDSVGDLTYLFTLYKPLCLLRQSPQHAGYHPRVSPAWAGASMHGSIDTHHGFCLLFATAR
jgi:hypothetical protein